MDDFAAFDFLYHVKNHMDSNVFLSGVINRVDVPDQRSILEWVRRRKKKLVEEWSRLGSQLQGRQELCSLEIFH